MVRLKPCGRRGRELTHARIARFIRLGIGGGSIEKRRPVTRSVARSAP